MSGVRTRLPLLGLASGGLLAGHVLDYLIVVRDPSHRHALLAETGHAYIGPAAHAAGAAAMMAVALYIGLAFARRRGDAGLSYRDLLTRLAPAQAGAFLLIEVLERGFTGSPLGDFVGPLLWVGLAVQVAVAAVCAVAAVMLDRAGARLARLVAARVRIAVSCVVPAVPADPAIVLRRCTVASRAPPYLLCA